MHIGDVMSNNVTIARPHQSIQEAAEMMAQLDAGMSLHTPVDKIMTHEVKYCFEDDDLEQIAANMAENKLRRLPVVNKQKRLVGMVSLGDISHAKAPQSGLALSDITTPGGRHSQQADGGARPV